jgi:3-dehydroquinate synthase
MIQRIDEPEANQPDVEPVAMPKARVSDLKPASVDGIECWVSPLKGNTPIHFGRGAFELLPDLLARENPDKVFVITDAQVFSLYRLPLMHMLGDKFTLETLILPAGETEKNMANLEKVCAELFERGITRSSLVVTFGGGVVLNLGGLAASLTYRGVRFIHVPTTLMSQSDVIVSNKQGINFAGGKNRLGVFNPPVAAVADPRFCQTESLRQLKSAMVEYAKNALLLGGTHYELAMQFFSDGDSFSDAKLDLLLRQSLAQKFEIARLDPLEKGLGLMLEYGHTVGHALEWLCQGRLMHGEAVWHGMNVAGHLANRLGLLSDADFKRQSLLLQNLNCMPSIPAEISVGQIMQSVQRDNKKSAQGIGFILLEGIGKVHRHGKGVLTPIVEADLLEVLKSYRGATL